MKSWREQGFVPDSDDEDDFESQGSKRQERGLYRNIEQDAKATITSNDRRNIDTYDNNDDDEEDIFQGEEGQNVPASMELDSSSGDEEGTLLALDTRQAKPESIATDEREELLESMEIDSVDGSQEIDRHGHQQEEPHLSQISAHEEEDQSTQDEDEIAADASADGELPDALTPRPLIARPTGRSFESFNVPSSPDELQLDPHRPLTLPPPAERRDEPETRSALVSENDDLSPLSSPPSSLGSLDLNSGQNGDQMDPENPANRSEDLLPPLDIPEEIMRELSQPTRRSLRQRNPIQLHPYLLEDARYQNLMKARGVKPVRLPNVSQQRRNETDESQEQDSLEIPEPPSSSDPAVEFHLPPSSPVDPYERLPAESHSRSPRPADYRASPLPAPVFHRKYTHSAKRRKITHEGEQTSSNVEVVISNNSSERDGHLTFDPPLSPPRSGSLSSTHTMRAAPGFRFPRGFTPPTIDTPITETRSNLIDETEESPLEMRDPDDEEGTAEPEDLSDFERTSAGEEEPEDESVEVKRLQKKIRGVLPASWLRLDLKQQEEQQIRSRERKRDHDLLRRLQNSKGIARKIIKPRNVAGTSSGRPSFPSFGDEDTGSDDNSPIETDSRKVLAGLVGFDIPFDDMQNDDIPEDNRIDYMFPSTSSRHGSSTTTTYSKRDKPKKHAEHHETKQRPLLRRQMRITDSMSKHRKERGVRRASRKPPKLGILDAPDVVQRPREDQPHFLRVAARQARSRRDHGRRSPTQKTFRLGTRRDTEDVNSSLRDWRKGSIRQTKTNTTNKLQPRRPLIDLSLNKHDASNRAGSDIPVLDDLNTETHRERVDARNSLSEAEVNEGASTAAGWARREGATKKSSAAERHHDKWVIPRKFAVSSLKRHGPRPAEFESVETSQTTLTPSLFQQSLSALNKTYRHAHTPRRLNLSLTLDRFLSTTHPPVATLKSVPRRNTEKTVVSEPLLQISHVQRQARKRQPKRIDAYTTEHQQPPALTLNDIDSVSTTSGDRLKSSTPVFKGLGVLKPAYSVDFNITPLQPGTYFHDSTFIGSGNFSRSLNVQVRDLDKEAGHCFVKISEGNYRWGAWNDAVSSELGLVFDIILHEIEKDNAVAQDGEATARGRKVEQIYRSIVEYATEKLWFLDPVDRTAFVDRCVDLISKLNDQITTFVPASPSGRRTCLFAASFNVVFANQVLQIASHDPTSRSATDRARTLLTETIKQATVLVFNQQGLTEIRSFLEDNRVHERREIGIRDDYPVIDAYVISRHVLDSKLSSKENLKMSSVIGYLMPCWTQTESVKDVNSLEQVWRSIFTTLPLGEIDQFGIYQVGTRFRQSRANWSIVKSLMLEVLDQYDLESEKQPVCLNNYCRVLFHRCFYLINSWGWRDCKSILDALFDFFAKNTLHNLKDEECLGSPSFLDELETGPVLEVLPGDPCFHIFLKIVGSGLRFMSQIYEKKKTRNFAWRLLPNHGRVYPKDKPLHHEDLDALRNHHDLLCTLFWAVPDGCRPRLETVRNLVDPTNSHRETCSISLRSWARLVRFKLSTNEDVTALEQFAEWHAYFVTELVKQHSLARTEVEAQGHAADMRFSRQIVESTISQNQKQIESLLSTALSSMSKALGVSPSLEHARILISRLPLQRLFGLFNPKQSRANKIVSETLEILVCYTRKDDSLVSPPVTASVNEDSQEYGDWTGIEEICADGSDQPDPAIEHVDNTFHPAVSRLVSNCFGEDYSPEDAILLKVVDCWTAIAHMLVKHRLRHWDSYVSPYGGDSWATLRNTVQTRKFTPYFLAKCIERDSAFYIECTHQVLSMWVSSLVERSSILKFQHYLTEVLLNQDPETPLLNNLPFSKSGSSDQYRISLEEFSERRLSLLSSLLSNMREHLQLLEDTGDRELSTTREHYRELIESLMTSMKANYQELGTSTGAAQGTYVAFVHNVVGFLQQHAPGICPVDRFFTEPTSFPLPATDPTYIVARLKSYGLRLSTGKAAKPLVVFIQSVFERAALDGQQAYLVDQLYMSMGDVYESGNPSRPTLCAFLLRSVFPAYIECAFNDVCGWILAAPVLQAVSRTFADMLFYIDTTDADCVSSVTEIFYTVFESSYRAMHLLVDHSGMIEEPTVLMTTANFLHMITSALPVIDYIDRSTGSGELLIKQLEVFRQITLFMATCLLDPGMAVDPDNLDGRFDVSSGRHSRSTAIPRIFHEARAFATRELQSALRTNWSRHDGKFFTRRGQQLKEVQIDPLQGAQSMEMAKAKFVDSVEIFLGTMSHLGIFPEDDR